MAEKGGRQERLSPDYAANVRMMDDILRVRDNFDVIRKDMQIGRDRITLYYIDGFVKDSVMEKLMIFFLSLKRLVPEESGPCRYNASWTRHCRTWKPMCPGRWTAWCGWCWQAQR